jgi:hypothetical protein
MVALAYYWEGYVKPISMKKVSYVAVLVLLIPLFTHAAWWSSWFTPKQVDVQIGTVVESVATTTLDTTATTTETVATTTIIEKVIEKPVEKIVYQNRIVQDQTLVKENAELKALVLSLQSQVTSLERKVQRYEDKLDEEPKISSECKSIKTQIKEAQQSALNVPNEVKTVEAKYKKEADKIRRMPSYMVNEVSSTQIEIDRLNIKKNAELKMLKLKQASYVSVIDRLRKQEDLYCE